MEDQGKWEKRKAEREQQLLNNRRLMRAFLSVATEREKVIHEALKEAMDTGLYKYREDRSDRRAQEAFSAGLLLYKYYLESVVEPRMPNWRELEI